MRQELGVLDTDGGPIEAVHIGRIEVVAVDAPGVVEDFAPFRLRQGNGQDAVVDFICVDFYFWWCGGGQKERKGRMGRGRTPNNAYLAAYRWPLAAYRWPLAAGRSPLAAGRWPLGGFPRAKAN